MGQAFSSDCEDGCASQNSPLTGNPDSVLSSQGDGRCTLPIPDKRPGRADIAARTIPFVVQHERSLFFLTWESTRWTLAELVFDAGTCTFVEQRRSHFEWPREAFGVLLSRFAMIERVEKELLQRTSEDFARWLGNQFRVYTHTP